jgi:hypothetical protein
VWHSIWWWAGVHLGHARVAGAVAVCQGVKDGWYGVVEAGAEVARVLHGGGAVVEDVGEEEQARYLQTGAVGDGGWATLELAGRQVGERLVYRT